MNDTAAATTTTTTTTTLPPVSSSSCNRSGSLPLPPVPSLATTPTTKQAVTSTTTLTTTPVPIPTIPTTTIPSSACSSGGSRVRFDSVQVRECFIALGDHPGPTDDGPSLTLSWNVAGTYHCSVDVFEAVREGSFRPIDSKTTSTTTTKTKTTIKTLELHQLQQFMGMRRPRNAALLRIPANLRRNWLLQQRPLVTPPLSSPPTTTTSTSTRTSTTEQKKPPNHAAAAAPHFVPKHADRIVTEQEMKQALRDRQLIQHQRAMTIAFQGWEPWELAWGRVVRTVQKPIKRSNREAAAEWLAAYRQQQQPQPQHDHPWSRRKEQPQLPPPRPRNTTSSDGQRSLGPPVSLLASSSNTMEQQAGRRHSLPNPTLLASSSSISSSSSSSSLSRESIIEPKIVMLETNGSNLSESVSLATFESGGDRVDDSAVAAAPCTDNGTPPDDDDVELPSERTLSPFSFPTSMMMTMTTLSSSSSSLLLLLPEESTRASSNAMHSLLVHKPPFCSETTPATPAAATVEHQQVPPRRRRHSTGAIGRRCHSMLPFERMQDHRTLVPVVAGSSLVLWNECRASSGRR